MQRNFPKKKEGVSSPGRAGLGAETLKGGGVKLLHPIFFPPHSKKCQGSRDSRFCNPKSPFFAFLFPFCHSYSLPTSKCTIPWFFDFPLMHFNALNCLGLAKLVRQFMMNSYFDLLNWGVVGGGLMIRTRQGIRARNL